MGGLLKLSKVQVINLYGNGDIGFRGLQAPYASLKKLKDDSNMIDMPEMRGLTHPSVLDKSTWGVTVDDNDLNFGASAATVEQSIAHCKICMWELGGVGVLIDHTLPFPYLHSFSQTDVHLGLSPCRLSEHL